MALEDAGARCMWLLRQSHLNPYLEAAAAAACARKEGVASVAT